MEKEKIKDFKDLKAWQEGHALAILVYKITKSFPREETYSLVDQMRRAVVSVTSNIAEGFGRHGYKEKANFYKMAQGSLAELENQMLLAKDISYIDVSTFGTFDIQLKNTQKLLGGLITKTKSFISPHSNLQSQISNLSQKSSPHSSLRSPISLLFLILFSSLCSQISPHSAEAFTLNKTVNNVVGIVGWWTFDGKNMTGGTALDQSSSADDGKLINIATSTFYTIGKVGQALTFDSVDDYITLGASYNGVKSVAFWIKVATSTTLQKILDLNGTQTVTIDAGTLNANSFTGPTRYVDGIAASTINDTAWHHVVITTGTGINASAADIGRISPTYFGGTLDDVRFYNRALSASEVLQLYNRGQSKQNISQNNRFTDGLVGLWSFDRPDISGTSILDRSGSGKNGTYSAITLIGTSTVSTSKTIAQSSDDSEECLSDSSNTINSSDLELTEDVTGCPTSPTQFIGLRFQSIPIPRGASTTLAQIQFTTDDDITGSGQTDLILEAEDVDDSATFTTTANDIDNRSTTTARVLWGSVSAWSTLGESGSAQLSPDFSGAVQEVIDRAGWVAGNDIGIIVSGTGLRPAESYDEFPARAAVLNLSWTATSTLAIDRGIIPGRIGQAMKFSGTGSDYVSVGDVYNGVQSVSFWLKVSTSTTLQKILDLNGTQTVTIDAGTLNANNFTGPTRYVDGIAASTINDAAWHHVVITTGTAINASAVDIGRITATYFGGSIDDIRFYSRALSAAEIRQLYSLGQSKQNVSLKGTSSGGLVGWWTFDGKNMTGGTALDQSSSADDGKLINIATSTFYTIGKIGQALTFDSVDDYITLGASYNGVKSVAFWVKVATSTTLQKILDLNGTQTVTIDAGTLNANSFTGPTRYVDGIAASTINNTAWHHVVITTGTGINASAADIGRISVTYFGGTLDDVRFYNRALSASEVLQLYNLGR